VKKIINIIKKILKIIYLIIVKDAKLFYVVHAIRNISINLLQLKLMNSIIYAKSMPKIIFSFVKLAISIYVKNVKMSIII